ncbi:MAG TPA: DUF3592 domain-containing protein [Rhizomicrobium sp.]|jgi:hypothetical protein|nr:DUF3592 domain-containing protein [Rhizomicrobium sp.]
MVLLIGLGFVAIGVLFIYMGRKAKADGQLQNSWPVTPGTIKTAEITTLRGPVEHNGFGYVPKISYEFALNGKTYTGNRVGVIPSEGFNQMRVNHIMAQYKPGTAVSVHYDPTNPDQSTLRPAAKGGGVIVVLGWTFAVLGTLAFLLGFAIH